MGTYKESGFTLVEVLVALFIFSVGAMAVVSMIDTSLRATSFSRAMTGASQVVQREMEAVKSMSFNTAVQKMCDGTTSGFGPSWLPTPQSCTYPSKYLFNNRTTTDINVKYKTSDTLGGLTNLTYDITMQSVKNYPITDVDMITGMAVWTDRNGSHKVVAVTYMEK